MPHPLSAYAAAGARATQCVAATKVSRAVMRRLLRRRALAHDLLRLGVERLCFARRLAQRLLHHDPMQKVAARGDAFGLLQGEALEVALAHELLDLSGALRVEPESFQRLPPEAQGRFVGLAQLELDPLGDERERMAAVEGAHIKQRAGKLGLHQIDNAARRGAGINTHRNETRPRRPPRPPPLEPRAGAL